MENREAIDLIPRFGFWVEGLDVFVRSICEMLRLAHQPVTRESIVKLAQSLPTTTEDMGSDWFKRGFGHSCFFAAYAFTRGTDDEKRFDELHNYFMSRFVSRSWSAKDMLIDSVTGVVSGLGDSFIPLGEKNAKPTKRWWSW